MDYNCLKKLEFDKIIKILNGFCCTNVGKKLSLGLIPSNQKDTVKELLEETSEAVNLSYRNGFPDFYDIFDIILELKKLESNSTLSAKSLLNLATILKQAQELKDYFQKDFLDADEYPILSNLFNNLYCNQALSQKIFSSIIDENTIDDKASKNLLAIRKQKRNLEQDIRSKLNDILHSSNYSKYIQENIITIRNDRFVIPVKEEYRTHIKGFIHDISNAGSTVFIEPLSVFEMNNELNALKSQEELEIEKILQELTKLLFPYIEELKLDFNLIGKIDFIFAKAKFSNSIKGITPVINNKKEIHLKNARHPFIDTNKVVPISIDLGDTFSILLITGPNTGGKTVALKTVGLLTCMACSGLNIPADENSSIFVFDSVFADIGDDQSIHDSLSTFSSHMTNIVEITNNATKNSLVLLDELGSGTDPLEGSRLAISILDFFKSIGSLCIATTHYQELKQYALVTNGFKNASVEFDISTLSPTYHLLIGIPGKSNAFEISEKLGLSKDIIEKAKFLMTSDQIDIENLLKNIYDNKTLIDKEKIQISQELEQISTIKNSLEKEKQKLQQQEKDLIYDAKQKAKQILLDAKEDANKIIKQMNQTSNAKELEALRTSLNSKVNSVKIKEKSPVNSHYKILPIEEIVPNAKVFVTTLNKNGIVISHISKSKEVQVQIGNLKLNVSINDLAKPLLNENINNNINKNQYFSKISKATNAKTEINVIGLNVEEAIAVVDKFLDDCILAKLDTARIIHGNGTGKLRNEIQHFLKNHPHVQSYRIGIFGEGEMGVTVVKLK